jgi:radical SAM protein with 4Fe4S-binding SPASM domain
MFQTILDQWTPRRITDYKSVRESSAFCMMPFIHLFVSHFGTVIPCCLTPWHEEQALGNVNEQSIEEIWNGAPMRAFRRKMLRDQQDERCSQCYTNEQVGLRSMRLIYNHLYEHKIDWALDTSRSGKVRSAKPIFWDIRFSNLCNFRCRICGHHSSSNWFEDAKAIGETAHETKVHRGVKDFEGVMKQLEAILPDLEEIFFAGGEPLIMEEHYQLLQLFIKHGKTDVQLRYNTNFSRLSYKGEAVFDLWKHFSNVQVNASLDGEQERGEYQRKGQS